jgi:hypothetical protein
LAAKGQGGLAQDLQAARVEIAKIHDLEAAFTPGGHFDGQILANIWNKKGTMTGDLRTAAECAANVRKSVQPPEKMGAGGTYALRSAIGAGIGGTIGGLIGNIPGAAIGGAIGNAAGYAVPAAARGVALSDMGQRMLGTPSYAPGMAANIRQMGLLPSHETAGLIGRQSMPAWLTLKELSE